MLPACDHYIENEDGTFSYIEGSVLNEAKILENALELKITGVVRPVKDAANANIRTSVAYTSKLTDYIINRTNDSAIIKAQEASPDINILNNMKFESPDDEAKAADQEIYC